MVEMDTVVELSREIKGSPHIIKNQMATKMVAFYMDERLLVTDIYFLSMWANIIPRAEDNKEAAAEVTAYSLRTLFESKDYITNNSYFPTGQWLYEPMKIYLRHIGVTNEAKSIAGLPAKNQKRKIIQAKTTKMVQLPDLSVTSQ